MEQTSERMRRQQNKRVLKCLSASRHQYSAIGNWVRSRRATLEAEF
jgi:hypothetical protein